MDSFSNTWILILVVLFSVQDVKATPSLKIETSSSTVALGDSVQVKCTIVDYETGHFIYWRKKQGSDPSVLIGTNQLIEDRFQNTGRYALSDPENQGGDLVFVLSITEAQAEDWGDYGCEIPIGTNQNAFTSVTVPTPVENIKMYVSGEEPELFEEYENGAKINFTEGQNYSFRCSADGSNPAPSYQMLIGGEDVTSHFEPVAGSEHSTVDLSLPEGLRTISFSNAIQTKEPIPINHESNTVQLWCYGSTEGTKPLGSYVEAKLFFAPDHQDDCVQVERAGHYQPDVVIQCTIRADPPVDDASVSWQEAGKYITLREGEKHHRYRLEVVQGETPDSRKIRLLIPRAFPQMFRTYTIKATSSQGLITHKTTLERDQSLESVQAASSIRACSLFIGCISILLAIVYS